MTTGNLFLRKSALDANFEIIGIQVIEESHSRSENICIAPARSLTLVASAFANQQWPLNSYSLLPVRSRWAHEGHSIFKLSVSIPSWKA